MRVSSFKSEAMDLNWERLKAVSGSGKSLSFKRKHSSTWASGSHVTARESVDSGLVCSNEGVASVHHGEEKVELKDKALPLLVHLHSQSHHSDDDWKSQILDPSSRRVAGLGLRDQELRRPGGAGAAALCYKEPWLQYGRLSAQTVGLLCLDETSNDDKRHGRLR